MKVRLIHWDGDEGAEKAAALIKEGMTAEFEPFSRDTLKRVGEEPPSAVVIDLTRSPSQGRARISRRLP